MPELDPQLVALIAVGAAAVSLGLALLVLVLALRLRRLRKEHRLAFSAAPGEDVVGVLGRHAQELSDLRQMVGTVESRAVELRELLRGVVSNVGIVRYDAFEDMGGALSFSAALLDERGDGVVVSAINGRTDTRTYAKALSGGRSEHHLTPEEEEAIEAARRGQRQVAEGRRRRRRAAS
jgi:hypothetical protein